MVGADIEPADIVAHDEEDIGLLPFGLQAGEIRIRIGHREQPPVLPGARRAARAGGRPREN